jgi:hypothetical protein
MYEEMAEIPKIKRGIVWCTTCDRSQKVNGELALQSGWPKCCGHTMTIDSPEERRELTKDK